MENEFPPGNLVAVKCCGGKKKMQSSWKKAFIVPYFNNHSVKYNNHTQL